MLQGGSLPTLQKKGGGAMSTFEAIYLMLSFGTFLLALLAYIDKHK